MTAGTSGYCQRTKHVHCAGREAQAEKSTSPGQKEAHVEGRCWRDMGLAERGPDVPCDRAQRSLFKLPETSVPSFLPVVVAPSGDVGLRAWPSQSSF